MSLVVIETRPLPGERGAADSYPDYRRALAIALAERHPAESIDAVVQFGEGNLSVLAITINGQTVSRDQPQFQAIAEEVLAVRVTSRLKRISRQVFVSA